MSNIIGIKPPPLGQKRSEINWDDRYARGDEPLRFTLIRPGRNINGQQEMRALVHELDKKGEDVFKIIKVQHGEYYQYFIAKILIATNRILFTQECESVDFVFWRGMEVGEEEKKDLKN